jgi:hypothetical protein
VTPVLALDHEVGLGQPSLDVALRDRDVLEVEAGPPRVEHRFVRLVVDLHTSLEQALPVLVRQQQDGLGRMAYPAISQARLVLEDERHHVAAGDVAGADDGEAGRVEGQAKTGDGAAGNRRSDGARVQHARPRQVVDVTRCPGSLCGPVLANDIPPDGSGHEAPRRRADYSPAW